MDKEIPLWVLLLTLLLGVMFTVLFGWALKSHLSGSHRSGFLGEAAAAVASFPTLAKTVLGDLWIGKVARDKLLLVPHQHRDLSGFNPIESPPGLNLNGLLVRADQAPAARRPGWYLLAGAFDINGSVRNAILAVSGDLKVRRVWMLSEDPANEEEPSPENRKFVHGLDVLKDGSLIFAFDGGVSLQRIDVCGNRIWSTNGEFHHAVSLDHDDKSVWTLLSDTDLAQVDITSGRILRRVSVDEVIAANPYTDILSIRQRDLNGQGGNDRDTPTEWLEDPIHLNDVDPLPARLAKRFDGFSAGDLLVSARSLNLIFVMDPKTLKIKWWLTGATRRQHDPDWGRDGSITVYDNRMNRESSRIVAVTPATRETTVLYDGRKRDFYSRIRGKHQFTDYGNIVLTSPQQGRAFEIDANGNVVLEFLNRKPGHDRQNYAVSELIWLGEELTKVMEETSCAR